MSKLTAKICCGYLLAVALVIGFAAMPLKVEASSCVCSNGATGTGNDQNSCNQNCAGLGTGVTGTFTPDAASTGATPAAGSLTNPLSSVCSAKTTGQQCIQLIIGNVIKAALGVVGSIALLMMTWGGYRWLTAMGNSERVEKGKDTLIWAALGLVVIFGAYAVTSYIITKLVAGK